MPRLAIACICALASVLVFSGRDARAQCTSDPISPTLYQFDIDRLFKGLDVSLGPQFPQWLTRYNTLNTTDPSPAFAGEDNNQNGLNDDDHIALLGAILDGDPPASVLSGISAARVSEIRASFVNNRNKVRPDLTLTIVFVTVNIIDEITADDPAFGESLKDLVAAYMTVGDAASVTFIRNLLITLGEIFIEEGVASGAIPGFVEGLVKDSLRNTVTANFVASRYESYGDAPGATKPNLLGASGDINGSGTTNLAAYNGAGGVRAAWLVGRGVAKPPLEITPFPTDVSVTAGEAVLLETGLAGGDGSFPFYDWKRIAEGTGATSPAGTVQSLAFPYALPADTGDYFLIVCDNTWVRTTVPVRLTVTPASFAIVDPPQDTTVVTGSTATFSVTVRGGTEVPTYQWFRGSTAGTLSPVANSSSPTLTLSNLVPGDSGFLRVTATGSGTVLQSNIVSLTVDDAPDTTPPVVTLNGPSLLIVPCGGTFTDPGATALDDVDGDLTEAINITGTVDLSTPDDYLLTYSVSDAAGNTGSATRTVRVVDETAPSLALNGPTTLVLECGSGFSDPGATAFDTCDGDLTGSIDIDGTVDPSTPGLYALTYSVSDSSGNAASISRNVEVTDTTAPVLALNGSAFIDVACGSAFNDPGATATDACDGNLSASIAVTGTVNTDTPGTYVLTYSVTDASGNAASIDRTVSVNDTTAPVLTLNGAETIEVECGTAFADPGATATDACVGDLSSEVAVTGSVDVDTPGTYTLTYSVSDPTGNASEIVRTVVVQDTLPPAITLQGPAEIAVECGESFSDHGATAVDACGGEMEVIIDGTVDTAVPGTYTLTYTATDPAGNAAEAVRTVTVADTTAPALSLEGPSTLTLECGTPFVEPGFTVSDGCASVFTEDVAIAGTVDMDTPGTYTLSYRVSDASGNTAEATRTVTVTDTEAPSIILLGSATLTIECGDGFSDPGAEASDTCSGNLDGAIVVDGEVDTGTVGLYTLTYRVTDNAGNEATVTRTVDVADTEAPLLTLNGGSTISVACGETFEDPGATVSDKCEGDLASSLEITGSVDTGVPGDYTLSYSASDASGNTGQVQRTVTVFDDVAPTVTLIGPELIVLGCGAAFDDPGAEAFDDCDGPLSVETLGTVNLGADGTYTLTYRATDSSGNSGEVSRSVIVEDDCEITILSQPTSQNLYAGSEARFAVAASAGFRTLSYQWFKDGEAIPGATTAQLRIEDINFSDAGIYQCRVSDGEQEILSNPAELRVFERALVGQHSADVSDDWAISLSELLRVIQFFNTGGFGCAEDSEDGYDPLSQDRTCPPHDSDYNPQEWRINLSELLRLIQFFNMPGGQYHRLDGTEDGFEPGAG